MDNSLNKFKEKINNVVYNKCIIAVLYDRDIIFIKQIDANESEPDKQPIEEALDFDYNFGYQKSQSLNLACGIYLCDISFLYTSSFDGESCEYDSDFSITNITEVKI